MSQYNFKRITVVPAGKEIIDIVLSKTQRKTPTVVHKHYRINSIRRFYATKIKFSQQTFHDKLTTIITEFPKLNDIHPFYADLINVEIDKDHYKLALGEMNAARHLIDKVASNYVTMMKYADSLFRCKRLKIAALGRFCTIMKQKANTLTWLEEIRQKLARMPSIDPNAPTILLCGCPNVGKSSFMNTMTNADVDVQPYAFTTKSLYVGHHEYETIKYQVIDTPGLLDRPLEERSIIEMKSITAMAHLRACMLFILDVSEHCGFSLDQQVNLFNEIKPLFVNKPVILALNKVDVRKRVDLPEEQQALVNQLEVENGPILEMSTLTGLVTDVKLKACNVLLQYRVERKMKGTSAEKLINRLHVAMPVKRDDKERPPFIPEAVSAKRMKTEREVELEEGENYILDLHKNYLLTNDDERYDVIPEIMNGKNIAEYIAPEFMEQLIALEEVEGLRKEIGMYDSSESDDEETKLSNKTARIVRQRQKLAEVLSKEKRRVNGPRVPRTAFKIDTEKVESSLRSRGVDVDMHEETNFGRSRSKSVAKAEARKRKREESTHSRSQSRARSSSRPPRDKSGVRDEKMAQKVRKLAKISQRSINLDSRKGEADRRILQSKPKHLFSGKRKMGKTDRR